MKFVRYSAPDGSEGFGVWSDGRATDLSSSYSSFSEMLAGGPGPRENPDMGAGISELSLLPPVGRSSKVLCMAVNYRSHIKEMNSAQTREPILFAKFYDSLTGPFAKIPRFPISDVMDYEGELAVVMGSRSHRVARGDAWDHVLGYTLVNDLSARSLFRVSQGDGVMLDWFSCKAIGHSTPVGPWIVTRDEAGDFSDLRIETFLNGDRVQSERVSDMVFDVPKIIEHVTTRIPLEPGDVISTGTPSGVGIARGRTLQKGDVVRVQAEGIGHIENEVV